MDPSTANNPQTRPPGAAAPPPRHRVPPLGLHGSDCDSADSHDRLDGQLTSTRAPSHRHTDHGEDVLDRPDVDHPLRGRVQEPTPPRGATQVVIGTPTVGRVSPTSQTPPSSASAACSGNTPPPPPQLRPRKRSPLGYESDSPSFANARAKSSSFADIFPAVKPMKQHSVIVTEGKRYRPVADDLVPNRSFHPFGPSFEPSAPSFNRNESHIAELQRNSSLTVPPAGVSFGDASTGLMNQSAAGGREGVLTAYLRGDTMEDRPMDANDPINNYTFFVGASELGRSASSSSSSASSSASRSELPADDSGAGADGVHAPFGTPSQASIAASQASKSSGKPSAAAEATRGKGPAGSRPLDAEETEKLVETLTRSFALQRNQQINSNASFGVTPFAPGEELGGAGAGSTPREALRRSMALAGGGGAGGGGANASWIAQEEKAADSFMRLPMHEALACVSRENLEDDTVSLKAVWESFKSEALARNILFGFRVTAFAVLPTFLLVEHPKTQSWFVAASLLPVLSGLFVRQNLGAMLFMVVISLQSAAVFMTWGVVMNAVGAMNNVAGWWCGIIFSVFFASMFGELPSKRLLMVFVIIVMQTEHSPGGESLLFPCRFALDFLVASGFALLATVLPFPTLSYRQANEGLAGLHKLYSAALGNAMKSYWAPVTIDAKMALHLIPFEKMAALTGSVRMAIHFANYEPLEFNLNNTLRGQRLAMLQRIKMHIYAMSAASTQRLSQTHSVHRSQVRHEIKEFERRMQGPAMELAGEVMKVLAQVGAFMAAEDIAHQVSFDRMAEKALAFSDFIERERLEMLFLRKLPEEETNACLRCFAFHFSLIDIALELQRLEQAMKTFDPSNYPSLWQRTLNFFFLDRWNDFWTELPHRLTLDRPYDIRLLKDGIRYTGAFAVACAFTLNYDKDNIYYFGMAILVRLAQQTASETLAIGVYRICGLCIGASLAYITHNKTHNLAELTLLSMTWSFISMCFSQHPVYGSGAQYVLVTSIAGLRLAPMPALLLTRITDNVFAFISYYVICTFIFPVDPIRVLWNTRTKCFLSMNDLAQTIVSLGCAPITMDGKEADFLVAKARATVTRQQALLQSYGEWMGKSATEPTLRGGVYPAPACSRLRLVFNTIVSLEEALVAGVARLHRPRDQPPSMVLRDMVELTRPFLLDAGRLMHRIFQSMIDATERHQTWSMEDPLHAMWRAQLACRSLHHVTGNMQRNFYAAVQQVAAPDKAMLNVYLNSSAVEDAFLKDSDPALLRNKDNEDLVSRILAMSFHMSKDAVVSRDDLQAFNAIIIVFELLLKTLAELLPPMIEIYEFEKTRHVNVYS